MTQNIKQSQMKYENYILESIDLEPYDMEAKTDTEKLLKLDIIFMREYGWHVERYGNKVKSLSEWLQGLPTVLTIDFYYHDIIKRGYEFEAIPLKKTVKGRESAEEKFCERYFNYMAHRLNNMIDNAEKRNTKLTTKTIVSTY